VFIKRGMDKHYVLFTHNEVLYSLKKEGNYARIWIKHELIVLCEINPKDKYCVIPHILATWSSQNHRNKV
jgi:hypothetical protein